MANRLAMTGVMMVVLAIGACSAADATQKCPPDWRGTYPECSPEFYLPEAPERCPDGQSGVYPKCFVPCPANQRRDASGTCAWLPCPFGWEGQFWPGCHRLQCPHGQIGYPPDNCHIPKPGPPPCPHGLVGYPPNCFEPCPQHQYRVNGTCVPVPCPTGEGWTGKFQPDCKFTPTCPKERPGVWPNCWAMYCPPGHVGVYPDCKPKSGNPFTTPSPKKPSPPTKPIRPTPTKPVRNTYLPL